MKMEYWPLLDFVHVPFHTGKRGKAVLRHTSTGHCWLAVSYVCVVFQPEHTEIHNTPIETDINNYSWSSMYVYKLKLSKFETLNIALIVYIIIIVYL